MLDNTHTFVLSLGGSLVVPNGGIDTRYLSQFNKFIRNQVSSKKRRFFIVVGGGATTRHYQAAAREVHGAIENEDLDWIGIHATRLNAHLLRIMFRDLAFARVVKHYEIIQKIDTPLVIAAGWKPGWSTDYCAVMLCQDYGMRQVINLTNIDQVYNKDPRKYPDAKPLVALRWHKYRAMVGSKWTPGMNAPFDPIAAKLAQELSVTVKILNGKNLDNLAAALDGKSFLGTTIK